MTITTLERVIPFTSRADAALFTLETFGTAASMVDPRLSIAAPDGRWFDAPGPLKRELVIETLPNAFVVSMTLNGWLGSHVMTLRFPSETIYTFGEAA